MSEPKWTPGPWESGYGDGITGPRCAPSVHLDRHADIWPVRAGKNVVCWLAASFGFESRDALKRDARLIAAAPELYESLQAIQAFCDDPDGSDKPEPLAVGLCRLLQPARAALAKARGEA
jgi:hypothetical protein